MDIDTLEDLAKELKMMKMKMYLHFFEEYARLIILVEKLKQILSKEHDCFKCESCG